MVVDGDGPEISSIAPAHGTIQDSEVLRISFTASDELSGLRHDAEQVLSEGPNYPNGDGDPTVSNLDKDNFESGEPISDIDGRSTDINVWYGTVRARKRSRRLPRLKRRMRFPTIPATNGELTVPAKAVEAVEEIVRRPTHGRHRQQLCNRRSA